MGLDVICVLGCRSDSSTLARRARAARDAFFARHADLLVASGGRAWRGRVEADVLSELVRAGGVPAEAIVRERCSLDTRDNATFTAELLRRRGVCHVALVTCAWHLPRAQRLFETAGLTVEGLGVEPLSPSATRRAYWAVRERLSTWKDIRRGAIAR